jgi:hypothetical protein
MPLDANEMFTNGYDIKQKAADLRAEADKLAAIGDVIMSKEHEAIILVVTRFSDVSNNIAFLGDTSCYTGSDRW